MHVYMSTPTVNLRDMAMARRFLGRTTVFIGNGETGKTVAIHNIMKRFTTLVSGAIVFCETADANGSFDGIVPRQCIYPEAKAQLVSKVYDVQKNRSSRFRTARDPANLEPMYRKVSGLGDQDRERKILHMTEQYLRAAKNTTEQENIHKRKIKSLVKLYAATVAKRGMCVASTPMEKMVSRYCNMKVGIFMVFDDCSAVLRTLCADEDLQRIFFQGRHDSLTALVSTHDSTVLPPKMRKNAHNIIFTDAPSALAYASVTGNGMSKQQKKEISRASDILNRNAGDKSFNILYSRGASPSIAILKTDLISKFEFGSRAVWKFLRKIPMKEKDARVFAENDGGYY